MFLFKRKNKGIPGYWYIGFTEAGKRKNVSTKTKNKAIANNFLINYKRQLQSNVIYLDEFIPVAMKYAESNLGKKSIWHYRYSLTKLREMSGNKPMHFYRTSDFENYKQLRLESIKPASVNIELRTLKAIFNIALSYGYIETNPLKAVKQIKLPEKINRAFTREQLKLILSNENNPKLKQAYLIAYYTGLRLRELCSLKWSDVDFEKRFIIVGKDFTTKSKRIRYLPVSNDLFDILNSNNVRDISGYIIENKPELISKSFKRILRKLNFPEQYHFHCLRHSFASALANSNVAPVHIQALLGHQSFETTKKYIHTLDSELIKAVDKVIL
jgi:integrase/recombinase XerD